MQRDGWCHCGAVRFSVVADAPYPFMRCCGSICRKAAASGGYAIDTPLPSPPERVHMMLGAKASWVEAD